MTLVVIYHCICCYTPIWAGIGLNVRLIETYTIVAKVLSFIHVPIFFLISGYLYGKLYEKYKKDGNRVYVLKKTKRLFFPYVFWGGLLICLGKEPLNFFKGISHLWFLMTLFEYAIIWHFCVPFFLRCKKIRFFVLVLYIFLYLVHTKIPFFQYFSLHMFVEYSPYYIMGFLMSKRAFRMGVGYAFAMFVIICIVTIIAPANPNRCIELLLRLCSVILCMSIFNYLENIVNKKGDAKERGIAVYLGSLSMGIYIIHHIVIQEVLQVKGIVELAYSHYVLFPLFLFFFCYIISVLFTALILKSPLKGLV